MPYHQALRLVFLLMLSFSSPLFLVFIKYTNPTSNNCTNIVHNIMLLTVIDTFLINKANITNTVNAFVLNVFFCKEVYVILFSECNGVVIHYFTYDFFICVFTFFQKAHVSFPPYVILILPHLYSNFKPFSLKRPERRV